MVKKPKQGILDQHLFRQEMHDVVPLKSTVTTHTMARRTAAETIKADRQLADAGYDLILSPNNQAHIDAADGSSHRKNGVQNR